MTKNKPFLWLFGAYVVVSIGLLLYSYTQVDLNLTLSRVSIWQTIQKAFQYVGFFQRPWSTALYLSILAVFYILYGVLLKVINKVNKRQLWLLILMVTVILVWSYPAFSYDFFNYMFTAKTVLVYHKNPYAVIPLEFSGVEPWLTFMRWTHLPSAYTPLWILLTLPAYLLGFGYFLLIMWNIKLLVAGFYLLTVWGIERIMNVVEAKRAVLAMAIFALNPLILIESLVSSHNDIVMMALAMLAIILFLNKKVVSSYLVWALSVAAKLMTIFLLPAYVFRWNRIAALVFILIGFVSVLFQREVLPWYWVWVMPFVALLPQKSLITTVASGVSLGLLLRYAPFLYFGHYNPPVPAIRDILMWTPIAASGLVLLGQKIFKQER